MAEYPTQRGLLIDQNDFPYFGTIAPYEPNLAERAQGLFAKGFMKLGFDPRDAYFQANKFINTRGDMGAADFAPVAGDLIGAQDAYDMGVDAKRAFDRDEYLKALGYSAGSAATAFLSGLGLLGTIAPPQVDKVLDAARVAVKKATGLLGEPNVFNKIPVSDDPITTGLLKNKDVLEGLPQTRKIPNYGEISIKPNPKAEQAAIDHSIKSGVPYYPMTTYAPLDKEFAAQVAREYDLMPHDPSNKLVAESYAAMRDELYGQYEEMLRQGIKPEFNPNPYSESPWEALADIQENNRLLVYPTNDGFGTMADFDPSTNPLLAKSPYKFGDQETLDNDIFRAVHDFQGHAKQGVGFRARGEENAFLSHSGTFSPLARKALASETRGQNSWLNYGKYGEHNRTAKIEDTIFADQKTGLLPNWVVEKNGISQQKRQKIWNGLVSAHRTGLEGAINSDGTITLMHRTPANIEGGRIDPSYYGRNLSGQTRAERERALQPDFVPRTYWGVDSKVDPYKPEAGLGNNQYVAKINGADIYDAQKDSDGLWAKGKGNLNKSEKELWKEGYTGYIVNHPRLGRVVQLFDPVDATKKLTIALPVGAAGVGLLSEKDEPQQGILY